MQALLFDLDGVIYQDGKLIDGAAITLSWVNEQSIPHLFVTNTTSQPRTAIVERLNNFGINVSAASILTPPVAASHWLQQRGLTKLALFIPASTEVEFAGFELISGEDSADAVIMGDMGERWDFHLLNQAFRLLQKNARCQLLALGMTRYWRAEDGLRLDTGPFVRALEFASDRQATVLGKPATAFFETALEQLGYEANKVLMVGDDIRADIGGARQAGLRTALVRTGKFKPEDLKDSIQADCVLESVAALPHWWQNKIT